MKYCMDASALIDLGERHYPERVKVFTAIWDFLYSEIDNGTIVSVDYVKTELERKADEWRETFIQRAGHMFYVDESIEMEYANLIQEIESRTEFRVNRQRERFMEGADPWVIAMARNFGECTVVTAETKSLADYGMDPVCQALGVKCINLVKMFEDNNIGL